MRLESSSRPPERLGRGSLARRAAEPAELGEWLEHLGPDNALLEEKLFPLMRQRYGPKGDRFAEGQIELFAELFEEEKREEPDSQALEAPDVELPEDPAPKSARRKKRQANARLGHKAQPTYDAMVEKVRASQLVVPDETGWKVGGVLQWLWVFVTETVTVYAIRGGRGFEEAAGILGENYDGVLTRDGWAPYRKFKEAAHQSCLGHLLRRCHENLETALRGTARVPRAVMHILQKALALRDRRDESSISPHGLAVATGRLRAEMDRLLE